MSLHFPKNDSAALADVVVVCQLLSRCCSVTQSQIIALRSGLTANALTDRAETLIASSSLPALPDAAALRNTSNALGTSVVTATLLVERIDASLARHSLTGLIDINRTAPLSFTYVLRVAYVLEQGSSQEWRLIGVVFIRLAAIYRLTPASGLPLVLPVQWLVTNLPSKTAFHQLPLAMAIYRLFGHMLTHQGHGSLALRQLINQLINPRYRIDNVPFRVVQLSDLPAAHPYTDDYKRTDPVIRQDLLLHSSFSSYLLHGLLRWWSVWVGVRQVLTAPIVDGDPRYRRLRMEPISEQQGIAVDHLVDNDNLNNANPIHRRYVIVSGFGPNETVAAHLRVETSRIYLCTTERSIGDRSQSLDVRFPTSMPRWRAVLRHLNLENDVINRGTVME
ncbi:unnamed protein product [Vitrella brassicaformis CCMP3155]|uniref:Uncharacterized protein n=1 Tax=Vitrella brassicaformis (strain CCMP3155) TaxID=1169540 RepID=A0A0G4FMG1_VITBC|nr:unnamed protein product [Vitrella brassicaformis CCMP3155]|eukprot:CEM15107.1 unnamed protein product [Vitrella brassicaformis CCMP3155]